MSAIFLTVEVDRAPNPRMLGRDVGLLIVRLAGLVVMSAPCRLEGDELRTLGATMTRGPWATDKTLERINAKGVELFRLLSDRRLLVRIRWEGDS